jgi:predicted PurR-regulated permease PerM
MDLKTVLLYSLMVVLSGLMVYVVYPFIPSMLIGAVFASVTYPAYQRTQVIRIPHKFLAFLFVLIFTLLILVPFGLVLLKGTEKTLDFFQGDLKLAEKVKNIDINSLVEVFPIKIIDDVGVPQLIEESAKITSEFLVNLFQGFIRGLPFVAFSIVVALFTMYFCLAEGKELKQTVSKYSFLSKERSQKIFEAFQESCSSVIVTNLVGGFVQGSVAFVTALLTGTGGAFLVGFGTFVMSFVPVLGTAPITLGLAIYSFYAKSIEVGLIWLATGLFIGISDNFTKAWVLKGSSQLHPYLGLLSVIGGLITLGVPGIILGPLIATVFNAVMPILFDARDK